jgi:hypothetical protein
LPFDEGDRLGAGPATGRAAGGRELGAAGTGGGTGAGSATSAAVGALAAALADRGAGSNVGNPIGLLGSDADSASGSASDSASGNEARNKAGNEADASTAPALLASAASAAEVEAEAVALIDVYFDCVEPRERDVAFDRLVALSTPVVDEFLRAMMEEDEDEFARAAAAAEMARRGDATAIAQLEHCLEDAEELFFFENAIDTLAEIRGKAFYDTARAIWVDPQHDADERRQAMLTMEAVDTSRALADFSDFIRGQQDPAAMPDDQIEIAALAFARHDYTAGRDALVGLRERLRAVAGLDAEEREEIVSFLDDGIQLLPSR